MSGQLSAAVGEEKPNYTMKTLIEAVAQLIVKRGNTSLMCPGCFWDSPSQRDHECLIVSSEEEEDSEEGESPPSRPASPVTPPNKVNYNYKEEPTALGWTEWIDYQIETHKWDMLQIRISWMINSGEFAPPWEAGCLNWLSDFPETLKSKTHKHPGGMVDPDVKTLKDLVFKRLNPKQGYCREL